MGKYTIKSGDSWWKIANENGMTTDELRNLNPEIKMQPGQVLQLKKSVLKPTLQSTTSEKPGFFTIMGNKVSSWWNGTDNSDKPTVDTNSEIEEKPLLVSKSVNQPVEQFGDWLFGEGRRTPFTNAVNTLMPYIQYNLGRTRTSTYGHESILKLALGLALKMKESSKLSKGSDEHGNYTLWSLLSDKDDNYLWKQINGGYQLHPEKANAEETNFIRSNPKKAQELLIAEGFDLGKYGADGIWGNISKAAWNEAKTKGYTFENGKLIKKSRNVFTRAMFNPAEHILGGFTIREYDDGTYRIIDKYDFSKEGSDRSQKAIDNNTAADNTYEKLRANAGQKEGFNINWTINPETVKSWRSDYEKLHGTKN